MAYNDSKINLAFCKLEVPLALDAFLLRNRYLLIIIDGPAVINNLDIMRTRTCYSYLVNSMFEC